MYHGFGKGQIGLCRFYHTPLLRLSERSLDCPNGGLEAAGAAD